MGAFKIIYSSTAIEDLDALPKKQAARMVIKNGRLAGGLVGDIKRLKDFDPAYRLRMPTTGFCSTWKITKSSSAASNTAGKPMTDIALKELDADIRKKRKQVTQLRQDLEDMEDYLDVLEARRRSIGKPNLTQAQVEKRFAIK